MSVALTEDGTLRRGRVPLRLLLPILEEAVARDGVRQTALRCGIHERRLVAIRSGQMTSVQFSTADRIVTRLSPEGAYRWYDDDLCPWYFAVTAST